MVKEEVPLTIGVCSVEPGGVENLSTIPKILNPPHHNINPLLNLWLQLPNITHAEERIQRTPADLMSVMVDRSEHAVVQSEALGEPVILVAFATRGGGGIDFIVERGVGAMKLPGGDADYWAVFFV